LRELNEWRLKKVDVPQDVIQRLRTYESAEIAAAVERAFGKEVTISSQEKRAEMERLSQLLSHSSGDPEAGKELFAKRCGTCHKLFGEGKSIGPPLDGYERGNLKFWLTAIIEPSIEIREGYQSYKALDENGRVVTGMMAAQDPNTVTLRTAEDQTVVLDRQTLETFAPVKTSLMPEQVLKDLTDQQIQSLFAYLALGTRR